MIFASLVNLYDREIAPSLLQCSICATGASLAPDPGRLIMRMFETVTSFALAIAAQALAVGVVLAL